MGATNRKGRPARLGDRLNEAFDEIEAALRSDAPFDSHFTVRTVRKPPEPGVYGPADVRALREAARVSQGVFAWMLGASPALVKAWELGTRKPSPIARRLLDQIHEDPAGWRDRLLASPVSAKQPESRAKRPFGQGVRRRAVS